MNPFLDIVKVDNERNLTNSCLITVGSAAGQGKSLVINTMILNYLKSGINVLLFSEKETRSLNGLFTLKELNKKNLGSLIMFNMFFENIIKDFNRKIAHYLEFMIGSTVIIIDGPMFEMIPNSFSYKKFKDENTRFVIFEKYNSIVEQLIFEEHQENSYIKKQKIAETLRSLAMHFKTHVITTTNMYTVPIGDKTKLTQIGGQSLMHVSDVYITLERNSETGVFLVSKIKNRFGSVNKITECVLKTNNLTLATIIK